MKSHFCVEYGYLETIVAHYVVEHSEDVKEDIADWLYDQVIAEAVEHTGGWYGMHGFSITGEDDEDIDEDEVNEFIEENTHLVIAKWDSLIHQDDLTEKEIVELEYRCLS